MASSPITSWQIDGEIVRTVSDFIFLGSTITVDGDCSHKIKSMVYDYKGIKSEINDNRERRWKGELQVWKDYNGVSFNRNMTNRKLD